ncbi:MAG: type II secretion system protein [Vicinamibacteria bacterium]|nr:type II secretion system protein [Vicinamibacteria bacterium]
MMRVSPEASLPRGEKGFSMPALLAMLAIMTLALMLAMPSWRYLVHDDNEQELIFRGRQISAAIARFQRKNGNALPASIDQLVQGKYLRKAYKDPMTKDGKWRIVRPGEAGPPRPVGIQGGSGPGRATPTPTPAPTPFLSGGSGPPTGPVAGVASLSTETALRLVNGTQNYNQWLFAPNVPFVIGGQAVGGRPQGGPNQVPAQVILRAPDAELPRTSR